MISVLVDDEEFVVEQFTFPGGEVQVKVPNLNLLYPSLCVDVIATIKSSDDVMALLLTMDVIRDTYPHSKGYHLELKYFPYARQDRRCQTGEALSVKVFANLINSLEFCSVTVWDIHNEDTLTLIKNCIHTPQNLLAINLIEEYNTLVAPDKGALPKLKVYSESKNIITGRKVRDPATGEITGTEVDILEGIDKSQPILIVDDICDGGRTFIELAKVLRKEGFSKVDLYVTHGIFSKGLGVFEGLVDNIFTTDSFYQGSDNLVTVIREG